MPAIVDVIRAYYEWMGCYTVGGSQSTGERRGLPNRAEPKRRGGDTYAVMSVRLSCSVSPTYPAGSSQRRHPHTRTQPRSNYSNHPLTYGLKHHGPPAWLT